MVKRQTLQINQGVFWEEGRMRDRNHFSAMRPFIRELTCKCTETSWQRAPVSLLCDTDQP